MGRLLTSLYANKCMCMVCSSKLRRVELEFTHEGFWQCPVCRSSLLNYSFQEDRNVIARYYPPYREIGDG